MATDNGQMKQKAQDFLDRHHVGVLSTVSEDGKPWGSPIYFIFDDEFNFFFVTRRDTLKFQNVDQRPWAALTVADKTSQTTVQILGKISKVPVDEAADIALHKLEQHIKPASDYNWVPPIMKVHKGDYMVLKITPTHMQYADYKQFKSDVYDDYIEKII